MPRTGAGQAEAGGDSGRIIILPDLEAVSRMGAERFARLAQGRDRFSVALSGGGTPRRLYKLLAEPPLRTRIRWGSVHVFWGDERAVPPDDPASNYRMAREALLDHVPIPPQNIHRIQGELAPEAAARAYAAALRAFFGAPWPAFDLVLLGMGKDGHTAALFPGTKALHEATSPVAAVTGEYEGRPASRAQAAQAPAHRVTAPRVTLTPPALTAACEIMLLAAGSDKAGTLAAVLTGAYQPEHLPAQFVRQSRGRVVWLVDKAAAAEIRDPG